MENNIAEGWSGIDRDLPKTPLNFGMSTTRESLNEMYDFIQEIGIVPINTSFQNPADKILDILKGKNVKEIKNIFEECLNKIDEKSILR